MMSFIDYSEWKGVADEPHWNEFVVEVGGKLVSPLIKRPGVKNADYLFPNHRVIAELKILETEFAHTKGMMEKVAALFGKYSDSDISSESHPIHREIFLLLKKPLQKIITKANRQIRETKIEFSWKEWKGVLICVNDGFRGAPPSLVMSILSDIMSGTSYRSIDGIIYLTNHYIEIAENPYANLLWVPMYADKNDDQLVEFVNELGRKWRIYCQKVLGPFDNSEEMTSIDLTKLEVVKGPFRTNEYKS